MYSTEAYSWSSNDAKCQKITIQRNECGPDDVKFEIFYCGICHTDVFTVMNYLGSTKYPSVPGHELAGIVSQVGANVQNFKVGDKVGVGYISESCLKCITCGKGQEHLCENEPVPTLDAYTKHGYIKTNSGYTFGGYSRMITLHHRFVVKIPDDFPLEYAGPIFCAGITMYSPLKHFGAARGGLRIGFAGIGGLGQMGIQLAVALGNEVTAISTSPRKEAKCKELGAKHFLVSTDEESMKKGSKSLDLILNTISVAHKIQTYLPLLAPSGTLVMIGFYPEPHSISQLELIPNRLSVAGSFVGSIPETQDCMDFCAKKGIKPQIEIITADKLDEVYTTLEKSNDSITRYVLDIKNSV